MRRRQAVDNGALLWLAWFSRGDLSEEVTLQQRPRWWEGGSPMPFWENLSWDSSFVWLRCSPSWDLGEGLVILSHQQEPRGGPQHHGPAGVGPGPGLRAGCWRCPCSHVPVTRGMEFTKCSRSPGKSPDGHFCFCSVFMGGEVRIKRVPSPLGSFPLLLHNGAPPFQGGLCTSLTFYSHAMWILFSLLWVTFSFRITET